MRPVCPMCGETINHDDQRVETTYIDSGAKAPGPTFHSDCFGGVLEPSEVVIGQPIAATVQHTKTEEELEIGRRMAASDERRAAAFEKFVGLLEPLAALITQEVQAGG